MPLPAYSTLRTQTVDDAILLVTLDREAVGNALNTAMGRDLIALFSSLEDDPGGTRVVVLTGAGEKAFCAGADLKERKGMSNEDWLAQHRIFERAFWAIVDCALPVIAAVNGHAFGGGLELALSCDFAYGASEGRYALPEVKLGIMPGGGGTQMMARAAGTRRAKELILTGREFTASQAVEWGLFNAAIPRAEVVSTALDTACAIAGNAPISVRQAKKAVHHGAQMDLTRGLWFEIEAYNRMVFSHDRQEGITAFNEKRKPRYEGR
jgi:enoyl-CoA hydratase/carnithine racemase